MKTYRLEVEDDVADWYYSLDEASQERVQEALRQVISRSMRKAGYDPETGAKLTSETPKPLTESLSSTP